MPTRLAVLGGRGWLGQAVAHVAHRRGLDVVVLSRTPTLGARQQTLADLGIPVVAVDPTDRPALARALAGTEAVVNAAGSIGGAEDVSAAANAELPDHVGALAAVSGWRLVHVGSAAEYGPRHADHPPVAEDHAPAPTSAYGRSKLAGTEAVLRWHGRGARVLVARVFNVVDADLRPDNPVHGLVMQALAHAATATDRVLTPRHVVDVGDPTTTRDISLRPWVADALVSLATRPAWPADTPVVNVCSGVPTAFGDLAGALGRRLGLRVAVRDLGWPRGGRVVGDPRRLRSLVELPPPPTIDDLAGAALAPAACANPAGEPR